MSARRRGRAGGAAAAAATLALALLGGGCTTGPAPMASYEGALHARTDDAIVVPSLMLVARMVRVRVVAVDGHEIDPSRATELRLVPGRHEITLRVDYQVLHPVTPEWAESDAPVEFLAVARHTYVPNAAVFKDHAVGRVDDMGLDYPERCLPASRTLSRNANLETAAEAEACAPRVSPEDAPPLPEAPAPAASAPSAASEVSAVSAVSSAAPAAPSAPAGR
jgi:hypothetical protein